MNDIQNNDRYEPYQAIQYDSFADEAPTVSPVKLLLAIARRWRMVIGLSLIIAIVITPFVWLIGKNYYETEGAIRVTPTVTPILFRNVESDIPIANYESFVNTQASLMASNDVLNRVADELAGRDLDFFEGVNDYATSLKVAVKKARILIEPLEHTELVKISMKTPEPQEAEQIINAFIRAYMAVYASDVVRGGDQRLAILEEKGRLIEKQMARQREQIRRLAEEYGTLTLQERYAMLLEQVITLQNEITSLEIRQMAIESNIKMNESQPNESIQPSEIVAMRNAFVNSDPSIENMNEDLSEQETLALELKQAMADDSTRLAQQIEVVASLRKAIENKKKELIDKFDTEFHASMVMNQQYTIADLKKQLASNVEYKKRVWERLQKANQQAIEMGRKQLSITDHQETLTRMKETYDAVKQRIDELEMERKRPAQVTIAYMASSVPAQSMKVKLTVIVILASLCFSSMLMLMLEKLDTSLRSPEDLASSAGVNVIGTITSPDKIDNAILPRLLAEDYRTIRANIGLFNPDSDNKVIVVTSPGSGDGKTTFSVNLATSYAKSGKKTLLIDGDLRKPDVAETLSLPKNLRGLQDLLEGAEPYKAVYKMPLTGIDILAADRSNTDNALDILALPSTAETIRNLCEKYEHVIIDTPPLLAFADALLWAKIADGIVLTSFVDRTCSSAFKETVEKINRIETPLIGAVVNNVRLSDPYRYTDFSNSGYDDDGIGWQLKDTKDTSLLLATEQNENTEMNS